jgi:hypothetical protein
MSKIDQIVSLWVALAYIVTGAVLVGDGTQSITAGVGVVVTALGILQFAKYRQ